MSLKSPLPHFLRKNKGRWENLYNAYYANKDMVDAKTRYSIKIGTRNIPVPINPGKQHFSPLSHLSISQFFFW